MRLRSFIAVAVLVAPPLAASIATAQSDDIVLVDNIEPLTTRSTDAGPDAASADDTGPSIEIIGISDALPTPLPAPAADLRPVLETAITRHARSCVARTVEPADANVRFMYLVREGQPNATLTAVTNDEPMHLSRLHLEAVRMVGDTHPIDIELPQRMFRECIQIVPLPIRPAKTERLSFRIKAGALILVVHDVSWTPL